MPSNLSNLVQKLQDHICDFVLHRPKLSLFLSLAITALISLGIAKLRNDFSIKIWFDPQDPLITKLNNFERQFGNDESVVVMICDPKGIFTTEGIEALTGLTKQMWYLPEVLRVDSLSNYQMTMVEGDDIKVVPFLDPHKAYTQSDLDEKKQKALAHKVFPGYLVSRDGECAGIFARLKPALGVENDYEHITLEARKLIDQYRAKYPNQQYLHSGAPTVNYAFKEITISDLKLFMPVSWLLIILVLFYQFRSLWGVFLPLSVIFFSLIASLGFGGFVNATFNNLTSTLPGILIAIGLAETIHILSVFFVELESGVPRLQAIEMSLKKNLWPTFFTCFTTFIGFITSIGSSLSPIADLGLLAGFGTLFSWFLAIFMVVPIVVLFPVTAHVRAEKEIGLARAKKFVDWIGRHAWSIFWSMTLFSLASLYLGLQLEVNSDPFAYFSEKVVLKQHNDEINKHFGGLSAIEIYIDAGAADAATDPKFLSTVDQLETWIETLPYVNRSFSIIDIIKEINQNLNEGKEVAYSVPDNREAIAQELLLYSMGLPTGKSVNDQLTVDRSGLRVSVLWKLHESLANIEAMEKVEAKMKELGLNGTITGRMPLYKQMNGHIVQTFTSSMLWGLILVSFMMIIVFKSVRLGILSMIPNVVPITFGGAVLYFMNHDFDIGSSIVASVVLGIAVDDTIHFLIHWANYKRKGLSTVDALANVQATTGPAILWTTLILCIGFGCFMLGDFIPNVIFGVLTSTMLAVALLYDLLFLPAILILLDRHKIKAM